MLQQVTRRGFIGQGAFGRLGSCNFFCLAQDWPGCHPTENTTDSTDPQGANPSRKSSPDSGGHMLSWRGGSEVYPKRSIQCLSANSSHPYTHSERKKG